MLWCTKARSISVFQPVRIPSPKSSSRDRGTFAAAPDNDLVSDDSRAFCVSPSERRRRAAPRRAHWIIRPYTVGVLVGAFPGQVQGNEGDDTLGTRAYANRPGASRLSSAQAWTRLARVRGKTTRRDRPTSADKLSAPLYKAQRCAVCYLLKMELCMEKIILRKIKKFS